MPTRVAAWLLAGAVLLAALPTALAQRGNPRMEFGGQSIDAMFADYMSGHAVPGLSLAIVQAPYIPRATGHGVADTEKKLLVGSNTLFDVGEMADAYVAVATMQLVEAEKLALDQPARKHLPDLPAAWDAVTVRDLLMHASGMPDYRRAPSYDPGRNADPASLSKLVADMPLAAKPGREAAYSATDYLLLARWSKPRAAGSCAISSARTSSTGSACAIRSLPTRSSAPAARRSSATTTATRISSSRPS